MRRRGKKFEVYNHEDGREFIVRYDKSDRTFYVVVQEDEEHFGYDDVRIEGKEPGTVPKDLKTWLKEHDDLVWEPILTIGGVDFWSDDSGLNCGRLFRAKRVDGNWMYRKWGANLIKMTEDKVEWGDVSHLPKYGSVGHLTKHDVDDGDRIMKYTPARWSTLQRLDGMLIEMKARLTAFFDQDAEEIIKRIDALGKRRGNLLTMLPDPPKEKEEP